MNDLLDFVTIQLGKMDLLLGPMSSVRQKGLRVRLEMSDTKMPRLTDRRVVDQPLTGLVNKSIQVTGREEVSIHVDEVTKEEARLFIRRVCDNRIGVGEPEKKKIFKAFCQIQPCLASQTKGTGLRLYLSQKLAMLPEGKLMFSSQLDARAPSPSCHLKIRNERTPTIIDFLNRRLETHFGRRVWIARALVIEGNPVNMEMMMHLLNAFRFTSGRAQNDTAGSAASFEQVRSACTADAGRLGVNRPVKLKLL